MHDHLKIRCVGRLFTHSLIPGTVSRCATVTTYNLRRTQCQLRINQLPLNSQRTLVREVKQWGPKFLTLSIGAVPQTPRSLFTDFSCAGWSSHMKMKLSKIKNGAYNVALFIHCWSVTLQEFSVARNEQQERQNEPVSIKSTWCPSRPVRKVYVQRSVPPQFQDEKQRKQSKRNGWEAKNWEPSYPTAKIPAAGSILNAPKCVPFSSTSIKPWRLKLSNKRNLI